MSIMTIADLLEQLGVSAKRVRFRPALGTATEKDVLDIHAREGRLCELVDGVLVEKTMGFRESCLAIFLGQFLLGFVRPRNLGLVTGADGMMRLAPRLVRIPDVAFISWERIPGKRMPTEPIPDLAPDLAVEVLSEGNTEAEMNRKLGEYFQAGVRLVWLVDPDARAVKVYTSVDRYTTLDEKQTLDGGDVLPGFSLPLAQLLAELDQRAAD